MYKLTYLEFGLILAMVLTIITGACIHYRACRKVKRRDENARALMNHKPTMRVKFYANDVMDMSESPFGVEAVEN